MYIFGFLIVIVLMNGCGNDFTEETQNAAAEAAAEAAEAAAEAAADAEALAEAYTEIQRTDLEAFAFLNSSNEPPRFGSYNLIGGWRNDDLIGGDGNDDLYGSSGNDYLYGGDGNDFLIGGDGNDNLNGGDGNNNLYGGDGNDNLNYYLYGGDGNNNLYGGDGNDKLYGGAGGSFLFGGDGNDKLYGNGSSISYMYGGEGDDLLIGGDGNDNLYGGTGYNLSLGGGGDDNLWVSDNGGIDFLNGGRDNGDTAFFTGNLDDYTITRLNIIDFPNITTADGRSELFYINALLTLAVESDGTSVSEREVALKEICFDRDVERFVGSTFNSYICAEGFADTALKFNETDSRKVTYVVNVEKFHFGDVQKTFNQLINLDKIGGEKI